MLSYATGFCSSPMSVNRQVLMQEVESSEPGLQPADVAGGRAFWSSPSPISVPVPPPPKQSIRLLHVLGFRAWPCLETGDQMF